MLRAFARDSLIYGLANIGVRSLSIVLVPVYTRFLSPDQYGVVDVLSILAGIVAIVVPLEITQALARFFPADADEGERRRYATSALWFAGLGYGAFLVMAVTFSRTIATFLFGSDAEAEVVAIAAVATSANGVFYIVQSLLRWSLRAARYATASLVYGFTAAGVTLLLVVVAHAGPRGFFGGQIAGAVVATVMAGRLVRQMLGGRLDRRHLKEMLRFSLPFIPSSLSLVFSTYVDRLLLNALATVSDVGVFGIGYRVASVVQLVIPGFQGAMTPLIYSRHQEPDAPRELARIFRLYTALSLLIWLALGIFAAEIVDLATAPEYHRAAIVVPLLVPAILLSASYVFMPGPAIAKRTGLIALVNIVGAILNTVLNVVLIPRYGILGAASATTFTAATLFALGAIVSQRTYPVPHEWPRLSFAVLLCGATIVAASLLGAPSSAIFLGKVALLAAAAGATVLLLISASERLQAWRLLTDSVRSLTRRSE